MSPRRRFHPKPTSYASSSLSAKSSRYFSNFAFLNRSPAQDRHQLRVPSPSPILLESPKYHSRPSAFHWSVNTSQRIFLNTALIYARTGALFQRYFFFHAKLLAKNYRIVFFVFFSTDHCVSFVIFSASLSPRL